MSKSIKRPTGLQPKAEGQATIVRGISSQENYRIKHRAITEALPDGAPTPVEIDLDNYQGSVARLVYKAKDRAEAALITGHLIPEDLLLVECASVKFIWTDYYIRSGGPGVARIDQSTLIAPFVFRVDQGHAFGPNAQLQWYCLLKNDLLVRVEVDIARDKAGFAVNDKEQYWPNNGFPKGLRLGQWGIVHGANAYVTVYWPADRVQWPQDRSIVKLAHLLLEVE